MCGIAGLIHKGKSSNVGGEMTAMLQALKHRGPDSTGYAVYGEPTEGDYVLRLKVAEAEDYARAWRDGENERERNRICSALSDFP
jgi:glutamate synthase domain-containing protein 1